MREYGFLTPENRGNVDDVMRRKKSREVITADGATASAS